MPFRTRPGKCSRSRRLVSLRRLGPGRYDLIVLGNLLKTFFTARPSLAGGTGDEAREPLDDEPARRFRAAVADWQAGRVPEAVAGCKKVLKLDPNSLPAYFLLAAIKLPGEDYLSVLARIHSYLRPRTYVEVGVDKGQSIRLVGPDTRAIGIDPEPRVEFELGTNVRIFAQTSDEFFAQHDVYAEQGGLPIDLAFIDGMHQFEFALRDFMNIEARCTSSSTILIHDVYPLDAPTSARERTTAFWSGDIWRLALLLRKHRPDLSFHTIAAFPTGLAIVRNLDPQSRYIRDHQDDLVEEYLAMGFDVLHGCEAERLAVFPNDWPQISALLDA
jgi:Methyltransferase domain